MATVQRMLAAALLTACWVALGMGNMLIMRTLLPDLSTLSRGERELTPFESYAYFTERYWFLGFMLLTPLVLTMCWFYLKRKKVVRTRWKLLGIGIVTSPLLLILAWVLFNPIVG